LRSSAAITRVELKRRRPSTAAFTIPIVSESRKMPTYSNQSSSVDSAEKERMAWITTGSCSLCASSSGAKALSAAAGPSHQRRVAQMFHRVDLLRRRPDLERGLQRWDRLVLRESDDDVQRFDPAGKVGLAGSSREQVVQGARTAELL